MRAHQFVLRRWPLYCNSVSIWKHLTQKIRIQCDNSTATALLKIIVLGFLEMYVNGELFSNHIIPP